MSAERRAALLEALWLEPGRYGHLAAPEFERLCDLVSDFHDIFALTDDVIGCVPASKAVFHRVPTPTDLEPLRRRG